MAELGRLAAQGARIEGGAGIELGVAPSEHPDRRHPSVEFQSVAAALVAIAEATLTLLTRSPTPLRWPSQTSPPKLVCRSRRSTTWSEGRIRSSLVSSTATAPSLCGTRQAAPATELVQAASVVITTAVDAALSDPLPLRAVVREPGTLNLVQTKGMGVDQLIEPRLCAAGASLSEAREALN